MFVRTKQQGGRTYHYLVTTVRSGSRVRQKTIAYLGEHADIGAALNALPVQISNLREKAHVCAAKADALRERMHPLWIERNGGDVPRPKRTGLSTSNKLFGWYWYYHEQAEVCEQRSREKAAQLDKLRTACSA